MSTATVTDKKIANEKPRLILTHGEKGGVGKTTVPRVIADFLNARDHSFRAFDAEGSTGQLLPFHPDVTAAVHPHNPTTTPPSLPHLSTRPPKPPPLDDPSS